MKQLLRTATIPMSFSVAINAASDLGSPALSYK